MKKIAIVGNIGSGKSYIAKLFKLPVFNADDEVIQLYKNNKKIFRKLKKAIPKFIESFPINKSELAQSILSNKKNLKKISEIVHPEIRRKMKNFIEKNNKKRAVILDIPLFLENKLNNKTHTLIFIDAQKNIIKKKLLKRKNFNKKLFDLLKEIQMPLNEKRKKCNYVIKNDFNPRKIKKIVKDLKKQIIT